MRRGKGRGLPLWRRQRQVWHVRSDKWEIPAKKDRPLRGTISPSSSGAIPCNPDTVGLGPIDGLGGKVAGRQGGTQA